MDSIFSFLQQQTFSPDNEAKYQAHMNERVRPVVAYVYAIGGIIPLAFLILSYFVSTENFTTVAPARGCYLLAWLSITWATFTHRPLFSLKTSLVIYTFVGVLFTTYLNIFLTQNYLFVVPTVLMFLIGIVISQMGSSVQLIAGLISFIVPLLLLQAKPEISNVDISVLVLLLVWATIAWIASIILEQVNRRLFCYEQALAETSEQKQKLLEKEAQSNHFKSQFLANMSHEIRTPLTSIIGYSESYLSADSQQLKCDHVLPTIYANSKHLLNIANDILDLSKIEAGKLDVENRETDLINWLDKLTQNQHSLAQQKGLNFTVSYSFPLPDKVITDGTRLYQILLNLTNNAIKFTAQGGVHVRVTYFKPESQLSIKIKDTGMGMSQTVVNNLFHAFNQADNSHSRRFGGTGLGLYISKELITKLGGDIYVSSEEGIGSEFSFTIRAPISPMATWVNQLPNAIIETNQEPEKCEKFTGRVLLAEDHLDNSRLIRQRLVQLGIEVCLVHNGEQAVEKALLNDFDLILMDIQMPIMDGMQATGLIRRNDKDTPIIALTANAMKKDIDNYLSHGFSAYVSKPIDNKAFIQLLGQFLCLDSNEVDEEDDDDLLFSIDSAEFEKMIAEYKQGLPAQVKQLKQAKAENNWNKIIQISHSIKGSAGNFGFQKLTEKAAELEQSLREQNFSSQEQHFQTLLDELDFVILEPSLN